jgi:hypothetical protein
MRLDRVVSTVDPDGRHTRKSPEARRDGYRAHVAADPDRRSLVPASGQQQDARDGAEHHGGES